MLGLSCVYDSDLSLSSGCLISFFLLILIFAKKPLTTSNTVRNLCRLCNYSQMLIWVNELRMKMQNFIFGKKRNLDLICSHLWLYFISNTFDKNSPLDLVLWCSFDWICCWWLEPCYLQTPTARAVLPAFIIYFILIAVRRLNLSIFLVIHKKKAKMKWNRTFVYKIYVLICFPIILTISWPLG